MIIQEVSPLALTSLQISSNGFTGPYLQVDKLENGTKMDVSSHTAVVVFFKQYKTSSWTFNQCSVQFTHRSVHLGLQPARNNQVHTLINPLTFSPIMSNEYPINTCQFLPHLQVYFNLPCPPNEFRNLLEERLFYGSKRGGNNKHIKIQLWKVLIIFSHLSLSPPPPPPNPHPHLWMPEAKLRTF